MAAYGQAQRKLESPELLRMATEISSNEGQHLVVLRQALGAEPAAAVPVAFEAGVSPAPKPGRAEGFWGGGGEHRNGSPGACARRRPRRGTVVMPSQRKDRIVMPNIGPMEVLIVLIVALLVLGPKRLPDVGRSLGKGIRGFKDTVSGADPTAVPESDEPKS